MSRDDNLFILGLKEGATVKEIEAAYKTKRIQHHPDRCKTPEDKPYARTQYDIVEAAFIALTSPTPVSSNPSSPISTSNSMSPAANRPEINRDTGFIYNTTASIDAMFNREKK